MRRTTIRAVQTGAHDGQADIAANSLRLLADVTMAGAHHRVWSMDMNEQCQIEIVELHQFFVGWFHGRSDEHGLERFANVLAPEFQIISPRGVVNTKDEVLASFSQAQGQIPDMKIWIENIACRMARDDLAVMTYEEWQATGEETTCRLATAIFVPAPDVFRGVAWLHVHETWKAS